MSCLCIWTRHSWREKSNSTSRLRTSLLSTLCTRVSGRASFPIAGVKIVNLAFLLVSAYFLLAVSGLLVALSLQYLGFYVEGEEIYRLIPGYKRLVDERPISAFRLSQSLAARTKAELATRRVYGDQSREVGYFYCECARAQNSVSHRQKYLNEALLCFRKADLIEDILECETMLADVDNVAFVRKQQLYERLYPLVLQHPTLSSCWALEHIARVLGRPQKEVDFLENAERVFSERNRPLKVLGDSLALILFAYPLFAAILVIGYRISLPVLSWFLIRRLISSSSSLMSLETINKLIAVELLRGNFETADCFSREALSMSMVL
jgi:hypothetical protein